MATTVALLIVAAILIVVFVVARFVGRQEDKPAVTHDQEIVIGDTSHIMDDDAVEDNAAEVAEEEFEAEADEPVLELIQPEPPAQVTLMPKPVLKESQQAELVLEGMLKIESVPTTPRDFESRLYGQPLHSKTDVELTPHSNVPEHLLLVYVMADPIKPFAGPDIAKACQAQGLRHGERSIFHQTHQGQIQFSVASAVEPGIFNLDVIALMHTPGLSFFLDMRTVDAPRRAFRMMLEVAHEVANQLNGEILTDQRQVLTPLAVGHYLARIKAFAANRNTSEVVLERAKA